MSRIQISKRPFSEVNINDPFFDSLRSDYHSFNCWFTRKANELAYVGYDSAGMVRAFVYLKREDETVTDVTPPIPGPCLKIGTLKIDAHGTRLGERFIKIILDELRHQRLSLAYVTLFKKQQRLIHLLEQYGFIAERQKGEELVYVKRLPTQTGNHLFDYPVVHATGRQKWMLAILPQFHTRLFPDSILNNESPRIIKDVPETNGIHAARILMGGGRGSSPLQPLSVLLRKFVLGVPFEMRQNFLRIAGNTACFPMRKFLRNIGGVAGYMH